MAGCRRILFYSPHAGVQQHYATMLTLGRIFESRGHRVDVAYCDALYERCIVMDSISLPPGLPRDQLASVCIQCSLYARQAAQSVGMRLVELAPHHAAQDFHEAVRLVEQCEDPADLSHEGIAFGALAHHDLFLARKLLTDQPLSPIDRAQLKETARSALVVYFAIKRMIAERGYTDVLVLGHYAVNSAAAFAARASGISWRFVSTPQHCNIDHRRLSVNAINGCELPMRYLQSWLRWKDVPLTVDEVIEVGRDMLHRFGGLGSHSYSPARTDANPLDRLGLRRDRKLVLALTSSLDERQAAQFLERAWSPGFELDSVNSSARAFPDQIAWLTSMCSWASGRCDVQLVIRIHPREGVNKRENVASSHLLRLQAALSDLPDNVRVVWPEDQLSTYDLIEAAHLVQCSWSTIGMEAARLGVPVMTADPSYSYAVGDFIQAASSPEQFLRLTEALLEEQPSFDRVALGLRFYCLTRLHSSVSIEDVNPDIHTISPRRFESAAEGAVFEELLLRPIGAEEVKLAARPPATPEMVAAERAAIHYLLRALVRYMFTGEVTGEDYRLTLAPVELRDRLPLAAPGEALLLRDGAECEFITADGAMRRYSPLVARLAALCGTQLAFEPSSGGLAGVS